MTLRTLLMSAGAAAILAGAATAQSTDGTMTGDTATGMQGDASMAPAAPQFTSIEEMTVGDVLGMNTVDPEGATIGEIDYVIEQPEGVAAVIGIGGFLGMGEYTVALPLEDFELNPEGTAFVLSTDKETLKAQPEFDESGAESLPAETPVAGLLESGDDTGAATDDGTGSGTDATEEAPTSDSGDDGAEAEATGTAEGGTDGSAATTEGETEMQDDSADAPEAEGAESSASEGTDDSGADASDTGETEEKESTEE